MNPRPENFDEIVGQLQAKTICKTLLEASKKTGQVVDHVIFSGPSGYGKTTFAEVFAKSLGSNFHYINAASIKNETMMFELLNRVRKGDVVFIDEVHSLPKRVSESIYTVLEDFKYYKNGREKKISPFTCLAATTSIGMLETPMKNRFNFVAEFEKYTPEELTDICLLVCTKRKFKLSRDIAQVISRTCKGVPREVKNRMNWVYNYMVANGLKSVSEKQLLDIIALQGIDKNGLDMNDRKYLNTIVYDIVGLNELCRKLNVDKTTVTNVIEPYLMEQGYVRITSKGREITEKGLEVL